MEPFDENKKVPDFFATRAQVRSDSDDEDALETSKQDDYFDDKKQPVLDTSMESPLSDDDDEVPYDFRAEYKERIGNTFAGDSDDVEKKFSSVRWNAIGIGILIGVLVALLVSVFLFGGSDDEDTMDQPIVVSESKRPVKVRPTNPGGMDIPDQDKTIYKRMRTDKVDTQVERFVMTEEEPVRPQVPTREGEVLGTPRVMPETAAEMELEVLSVQQKAVQVPAAKPVVTEAKPVKTVSAEKAAPKAVAAPAKVETVKKPVAVASASTPAKKQQETSTAMTKTWHVQLISLPSKAGAQKAWPKILKAHSTLLSGLPHDIAEVQIKGKGKFYRLRVGDFAKHQDAQNLCNKLKARKQDCTLTK